MAVFKEKNIRKTAFRQKVLDVFYNNENAVTIAQIESSLGSHDRITLYRTIRTFIDAGVIHEIVMPGDLKKLALCNDCVQDHEHNHCHVHHHKHVHFHCEKCDEIICVDNDLPIVKLAGYRIDQVEVQAHGVCPKCL